MVCKTPSIALDSEEFKEARDAWLKEKRGERKMKQGDRGCKEWVEMTIADKSARKLLELQESVPEQNTLKQMLNKAGYKEHSSINPLILQSKVLEIVKEWLQEHIMQPEVRNMETTDELELNFTAGQIAVLRKLMEDLDK